MWSRRCRIRTTSWLKKCWSCVRRILSCSKDSENFDFCNEIMISRYLFASVKGQSSIGNIQFLRRFYKRATIELNKQQAHPLHKYVIQLDGKSIKTPNRHTLAVPTERLALMLVFEFEKQEEYLKPALMPFLALCRTAVDIDMTPNLR